MGLFWKRRSLDALVRENASLAESLIESRQQVMILMKRNGVLEKELERLKKEPAKNELERARCAVKALKKELGMNDKIVYHKDFKPKPKVVIAADELDNLPDMLLSALCDITEEIIRSYPLFEKTDVKILAFANNY